MVVKLTVIQLPFLVLCLAVTTLIRCQQLMPQNLNPQVTNRNFPTVMLNGGGDGSALPAPPPGFTLVPTFAGPFLVPITQERRQPLPSPSSASVRPSTSQLPPQNGLQNLFQAPVATPQPPPAASNHGGVNFRNGNGNAGGDHHQMPSLFMPVNDRRPPVDQVFNPFLQVQPEFPFHHDQQQQHQQLQPSTSGQGSSGSQGQRFSQPLPASGTSRPHTNEHLAAVFQTPSQQQRPVSNNFSPLVQQHQNVQTPSPFIQVANDQDQRGQLGLFQSDIGPNNILNGPTSGSSPQMNNFNFGGGQESPLPTDGGGQTTTSHNSVQADAVAPGTTSMLTLVDFVPSTNAPSTHYFIGLGPTISDRPNNDNNGAEHQRPPSTIFHVETHPSSSPTSSAKPTTTLRSTTIAPLLTETPPTTHFWVEMSPQFNADIIHNPTGHEVVDSGGLSEQLLSSNGRPSSTSETSVIFPGQQQQRLPEDAEVFRPATPSPANPHIQEQGAGAGDEQQFEQEHQQAELPFVNQQQTTSGGGSNRGVTLSPPTNDPNEGSALWSSPEAQTPQPGLNHNLDNQNLNQDNNEKNRNHHGEHGPSSTTLTVETPRDNNVNNVHLESTISTPPEQSIIIDDRDHGSVAFQEELSTSSNNNGIAGHHGPFRNDQPPSTGAGVTFPTTLQEVSEESSSQELTTQSSPSSSLPTTRRQKQKQLELMQSPGFVAILNGLQRNRSQFIAPSNEDQLQRPQATTIKIPSERTRSSSPSSTPKRPTTPRKVHQRVTRPERGRLATRRLLIRRPSLKTRKTTTTEAAPRTTAPSPTTAAESVTELPSSPTLQELPTTSGQLLTMMRDVVTPSPTATSSSLHDNNKHFPSSPADTPEVGSDAILCDPSKCRLPHCFCGGNQLIPGDLEVSQVPQMVLLTFDDSVNEINYAFYSSLLNDEGRKNPNGCPISATFYVSHEWTDYGKIQTLYAQGHEIASHSITHSDGAPFTEERWLKEIYGQKRILSALGGVRTDDIRGMRAPFLQGGGNKQFAMLRDANFTYDSSIPSHLNNPPTWPYTFDYRMPHTCGIPPCPTKSYPGVWEVPMVMWEDLKRGHCAMADACQNPTDARGVYDMLVKNFKRHYTSNRAPFGMFYHYAWFTHEHHREGFLAFIEAIMQLPDVYMVTNSQLIEWMRQPTPLSRIADFEPWQCAATRAAASSSRPAATTCSRPKRCSYRFRGDERQFPTCQPCPEKYPWLDSYDELPVLR